MPYGTNQPSSSTASISRSFGLLVLLALIGLAALRIVHGTISVSAG